MRACLGRARGSNSASSPKGRADIYPRLSPTSEWDTAAGHAVLLAAGGRVDGPDGTPLRYGKTAFLNRGFCATGGLAGAGDRAVPGRIRRRRRPAARRLAALRSVLDRSSPASRRACRRARSGSRSPRSCRRSAARERPRLRAAAARLGSARSAEPAQLPLVERMRQVRRASARAPRARLVDRGDGGLSIVLRLDAAIVSDANASLRFGADLGMTFVSISGHRTLPLGSIQLRKGSWMTTGFLSRLGNQLDSRAADAGRGASDAARSTRGATGSRKRAGARAGSRSTARSTGWRCRPRRAGCGSRSTRRRRRGARPLARLPMAKPAAGRMPTIVAAPAAMIDPVSARLDADAHAIADRPRRRSSAPPRWRWRGSRFGAPGDASRRRARTRVAAAQAVERRGRADRGDAGAAVDRPRRRAAARSSGPPARPAKSRRSAARRCATSSARGACARAISTRNCSPIRRGTCCSTCSRPKSRSIACRCRRLCIAAAVPATTALRWIKTMTDNGLFLRRADPHDGRRVFIELAPDASVGMRRYFAEVGALAAV